MIIQEIVFNRVFTNFLREDRLKTIVGDRGYLMAKTIFFKPILDSKMLTFYRDLDLSA